MTKPYIDITFPISKNLPSWPGSIGFNATWHCKMPIAENNLSSINIDNHYGTHIDAPRHFIRNGKTIDQLDLSKMIGPSSVIEIRGVKRIDANALEQSNIPRECKRLIIKTDNQAFWEAGEKEFNWDFSALDASAANWLVKRGIEFIGIDYLSIQRFHDGPEVHQILLDAEVIIAESLNLKEAQPGTYELVCLPLNLVGLEGSPVRALLKPYPL
jgi:arylformamidase